MSKVRNDEAIQDCINQLKEIKIKLETNKPNAVVITEIDRLLDELKLIQTKNTSNDLWTKTITAAATLIKVLIDLIAK